MLLALDATAVDEARAEAGDGPLEEVLTTSVATLTPTASSATRPAHRRRRAGCSSMRWPTTSSPPSTVRA